MQTHIGDILSVEKGIIVHGCNAQGKMRSGIAKAIREKYPQVYEDYKAHEKKRGLQLGDAIYTVINNDLVIVSAITQEFYGYDKETVYVDYDAIEQAFLSIGLVASLKKLDVHVPLIGCGLANGKWSEVKPRIEGAFHQGEGLHLWILSEAALNQNN
jgi:O-acetyl-ADP-ribose deacetylase (regulator of RNase III)